MGRGAQLKIILSLGAEYRKQILIWVENPSSGGNRRETEKREKGVGRLKKRQAPTRGISWMVVDTKKNTSKEGGERIGGRNKRSLTTSCLHKTCAMTRSRGGGKGILDTEMGLLKGQKLREGSLPDVLDDS